MKLSIGMITSEVLARFWCKVDKNGPAPAHIPRLGPCWIWTGSKKRHGYGRLHIGGLNGRHYLATHISWFLDHGSIDDSLDVLHHCDNPPCVNPNHLFQGTMADNVADAIKKGRLFPINTVRCPPEKRKLGIRNPAAKLTEENVLEIYQLIKSKMPFTEIAKLYGVSDPQIHFIQNGTTWSHVTGIPKKIRRR